MRRLEIQDLPRNDVGACVKFYKSRGHITPNQGQMMFMLQDNPRELIKISKNWKILR